MSGEREQDVIFGRNNICKAYGFGKDTFYWLIEKKAPIKRVGKNRYMVHRESLDQFFLLMTLEDVPAEIKKKAAR